MIGINKWQGGVISRNGKIYGIPADSTSILVIDPSNNSTYTFGSLVVRANKFRGGAIAPNGYIYGMPANANSVLIIDPSTDTVLDGGIFGGGANRFAGGVLATNGTIYSVIFSNASIFSYSSNSLGTWPSDFYLSPYFNKF